MALPCAHQFTLEAIRRTRHKVRFGMTEDQVRSVLMKELARVGLVDGWALVLFGGE